MRCFTRPRIVLGLSLLLAAGTAQAMALPLVAAAQFGGMVPLLHDPLPLLHSSAQGYLGVGLADVDKEKAQELKLHEVRGALVTVIDHDAPAGKVGLCVNDVVLALDGKDIKSAAQLRKMLKETPPGRKVNIEISRKGNIQTVPVTLAGRKAVEHDAWTTIGNGGDLFTPAPGMGLLASGDTASSSSGGFHFPFFGSSLNVGVMVEPLTSQMAEYLGITSGLMVKQVARKSEAALSGLRAFDVILKVGAEAVTNVAGWDRALRANRGKPVQITILRDKKMQTLTLLVDSKRGQGEIEEPRPASESMLVAERGSCLNTPLEWNTEGSPSRLQQIEQLFHRMLKPQTDRSGNCA
ncbi:MAG: PDZ domain-containing protein [Acidobacteriota bacterium]